MTRKRLRHLAKLRGLSSTGQQRRPLPHLRLLKDTNDPLDPIHGHTLLETT